MGPKVDLSIIIVCYKSDAFITGCLDSIFTWSDLPQQSYEIIIVDNSPSEYAERSFASIRQRYPHQNIQLIANPSNGGYGQGNNLGIKAARGQYLCIMNPDIKLIQPIFQSVLDRFQQLPQMAMLGGKQLGGKDLSYYMKPEYEFHLITGTVTRFCNKLNLYHNDFMYLSGALLFIDKAKFEEIGLFDENIFMYFEEPDITRRFSKINYSSWFDHQLPYLHLISDRGRMTDSGLEVWLDSVQYYFSKFNCSAAAYLKQWLIFYHVLLLIYTLTGNRDSKQETAEIISQFKKKLRNLKGTT